MTVSVPNHSSHRFAVIDFYRYFAAVAVFLFHLGMIERGGRVWFVGSYGLYVDLFFIISGFVMVHVYRGTVTTLGRYIDFLRKRIARIYPLHVLVLALFVAASVVSAKDEFRFSASDLLVNVLLLQAWGFARDLTLNKPAWSISAELFCYMTFPVVVGLVLRAQIVVAGLSVALLYLVLCHGGLPLWQTSAEAYGANVDFGLLRALMGFANGIVLYRVFTHLSRALRPCALVWRRCALACGAGLILITPVQLVVFAKPDLAILIFSAAIVLTAIGEDADRKVPGYGLIERLGNTSFAVYMLHDLLIITVFEPAWVVIAPLHVPFWAFCLACVAILTIVADVVFRSFENPARRWISSLGRGVSYGDSATRAVAGSD